VFWIRFELNADTDPAIKLNAAADPDLGFDNSASHWKKFQNFPLPSKFLNFNLFYLITRYLPI
jgi:hypothetical protein